MSYDFLEIYYPKDGELDPERVRAMRSLLSLRIRNAVPGTDTAPNSPFGDTYVTPAAVREAGLEVAFNRFLSDLDPENAAAGVVYNCDFVEAFLQTYGIYDPSTQSSYGILRLQFADREPRTLDRSTTFRLGDGTYTPYLPFAGGLRLLAPGIVGLAGTNTANYHPSTPSAWVVDVLVTGSAGQLAAAGVAAEIDRVIPGLTGAAALATFRGGQAPGRVQELARQVRNNFHARTPVSRGGATNLISQRFPEITTTAAVVSGDPEMARDAVNPGQVAGGRLDLLVKTPLPLRDTIELELVWGPTEEPATFAYSGWLDLPETPLRIVAVAHAGTPLVHRLFSVSTDPLKPGLSAAYGRAERLLLAIPQAFDAELNPLIQQQLRADGAVVARFSVTYDFDPDLKTAQEFMAGEESVPVGLDLYVRGFLPAELTKLAVTYNRRAGVTFKLAQARADILLAYGSHTADNPATPAQIADALFYAGANSVESIQAEGVVRFSVAQQVWLGQNFVMPVNTPSWVAFLAACEAVPAPAITSVYEPEFSFLDTLYGTYAASGPRNISWLLDSANLELIERRSV